MLRFLGFWILCLLRAWVEVLGTVSLSRVAILTLWSATVVFEILVVDGECLLNLLVEGVVIAGAVIVSTCNGNGRRC